MYEQGQGVAEKDNCLKARKCTPAPFNQSNKMDSPGGCGPGQTGHHIIPDAALSPARGEKSPACPSYDIKPVC